jgi:hypothetical protein
MTLCGPEIFGADPVRIKWNVVRGDSSPLRIDFLEDDEVTFFDTSSWTYLATSYDPKTDILDPLSVVSYPGYVEILASPSITQHWGSGYRQTVAELMFDLQVTIDNNTVWTPVVGTISVSGDVTGGSL